MKQLLVAYKLDFVILTWINVIIVNVYNTKYNLNKMLLFFPGYRLGRLKADTIKESSVESSDACASLCLNNAYCQSFSYDFGKHGHCLQHDTVTGHDVKIYKVSYILFALLSNLMLCRINTYII